MKKEVVETSSTKDKKMPEQREWSDDICNFSCQKAKCGSLYYYPKQYVGR